MSYPDYDGRILELNHALIDSKALIDERGSQVIFRVGDESDIERDAYSSIKKVEDSAAAYTMNAFPINYQPSRNELEKAGLTEQCDVSITTTYQDWLLLGITNINEIDLIRTKVEIGGDGVYKIKDRGESSQFNITYLFWTFGLVRV